MRDAPDPKRATLFARRDKRRLERGRRSEAAELVGGEWATSVECQSKNAAVGCALCREGVGVREQ
jgi:hypothetical protein